MQFSKNYVISAIALAAIGVAVYGFSMQSEPERPGQAFEIQDGGHIPANAPTPAYSTNPPTSGAHSSPVRGGFYSAGVKDINAVHNLEHGFIWIAYKDIDGATVAKLKQLAQRFSGSLVVSLRVANDTPLVLSSWGRRMELSAYDEKTVIDFVQKNRNRSPERLAR